MTSFYENHVNKIARLEGVKYAPTMKPLFIVRYIISIKE